MQIVARTAWLGVFCLLGLGPVIFVKVVTGASAPPVTADMVDAAPPSVAVNLKEDTLAKADRLPGFQRIDTKQTSTLPVAAAAPADVVLQPMPDQPPTIVGRHWHEGDPFQATKRKPGRRMTDKKRDTTIASSAHANGR